MQERKDSTNEFKVHDHFPRHIPINFADVKNKSPDRTFYIRDKFWRIKNYVSQVFTDIYSSLCTTLSLDQMDYRNVKKIIMPILTTGIQVAVVEAVTQQCAKQYAGSDDYDFVFKLLLSSAIFSYSACHKMTEHRFVSPFKNALAVSSEILAIGYTYQSTYKATDYICQKIFYHSLPANSRLVLSLMNTSIFVPGAISLVVKKFQNYVNKKDYHRGSQSRQNAMFSVGLTFVGNTYLQANYFLIRELMVFSRFFQLGLISHNIIHGHTLLHQLRNWPALLFDAVPPIIKDIIAQRQKVENDFRYNTYKHSVIKFTKKGPVTLPVPRYRLRKGDLVACDHLFNFDCVPVSGTVVALAKKEDKLIQALDSKKFTINLKSKNGEDNWIEHKTKTELDKTFKPIDLRAIHQGQQAAVLMGTKLNIFKQNNFYICINEEKERTEISQYQKTAVINNIISQHKKAMVYWAVAFSIISSTFARKVEGGIPESYHQATLRLVFNLFQMLIPFSEAFLREMVNSKFLKKMNHHLRSYPFETLDALRLADFCNALAGYYSKEFPSGMAFLSDKTGTLTTSRMEVLGFWTSDMDEREAKSFAQSQDKEIKYANAQNDFEKKSEYKKVNNYADEKYLVPDLKLQENCFEIFAAAFTNNKKEVEPEEYAIKQMFAELGFVIHDDIKILGNNHFVKTISKSDQPKDSYSKMLTSYHLGLYRSFGGRLSLVRESNNRYLIFCGIPKSTTFADTELLKSYRKMKVRTGVLSRDWCIAAAAISEKDFSALETYFKDDNKQEIEKYICSNTSLIYDLEHYCTFIINNPVKKSAEYFIQNCKKANVPVFIATGDTSDAAKNIVRVLSKETSQNITVITPTDVVKYQGQYFSAQSTVIFSGITNEMLSMFREIIKANVSEQPVIIFSEMSTEGKGQLARFLKDHGYFVAVNGDGSNDIAMMQSADVVFAHLNEEGGYAPGIAQFSNLNDLQLQQLLSRCDSRGEAQSFYDLIDIQNKNSKFKNLFTQIANSQEKVSIALFLKIIKTSVELATSFGYPAKEMWQQHWMSVGFDLIWLAIAFNEINHSANLPANNAHLNNIPFRSRGLLMISTLSAFISFSNYMIYGEATNLTTLAGMLCALPLVLRSMFYNYGSVQQEKALEYSTIRQGSNDPDIIVSEEKYPSQNKNWRDKFGFFGSCLRKRKHQEEVLPLLSPK